jgi:hypothetical protein
MKTLSKAVAAGAIGAVTTNVLHEIARRSTQEAPRVDLLGMQALAHLLKAVGTGVPDHGTLYRLTLAGDLVSNSGYFALLGAAPGDRKLAAGAALGLAAGLGAVYLPGPLGLSTRPTDRGVATRAITVALYGAGGVVAGAAYRALPA